MKGRDTLLIVALSAVIALAILAVVLGSVAAQRGRDLADLRLELAASKSAEKAEEKKTDEIEKTPAADLVSQSPRAGELERARDENAAARAAWILDQIRIYSREAVSGGSGGPLP